MECFSEQLWSRAAVIMSGYDFDYDVFLSQPSSTNTFEVHINSDFEALLNSDLNELPNSSMGKFELTDFEDLSSGSDTDMHKASQNIQSSHVNLVPGNSRSQVTSPRILQGLDSAEESVGSSSAKLDQPVTDFGLRKLCDYSAHSMKIESKCKWAVGVYQKWVRERRQSGRKEDLELNPDIVLLALNEKELNKNLMFFIMEVRNQKGEEYRGNTLHEIVASLQYYIRRNGTQLDVFESPIFHGLRSVLGYKMGSLARQGIGIEKRQAQVISVEQQNVLWVKEILNESTPQHLLDTMVYLIGSNCALRAGDEHRSLRTGPNSQFEMTVDEDGSKRLKYIEDVFRIYRGGIIRRKGERRCVSISQDFDRPQRCLVRLFEKYMSLRPKDGKCTAFYLRPLKYIRKDTWYADIPVGLRPLRSTVGRLCQKAGFSGFYSNHSLVISATATSATIATPLYDSGLEEQLIVENTGHTSLAIRNLKKTSADMEARADGSIHRKSTKSETAPTTSALTSTNEIDNYTAS